MKESDYVAFEVTEEQAGSRLDKWLSEQAGLSRSQVQQWIDTRLVLLNGQAAAKNAKLRSGDKVSLKVEIEPNTEILPQNIPLDIVFEDESILVVNKARGMVVHPAAGNQDGTLVNALLYHCKGKLADCNGDFRQGIVHRIDKDTSGLLVVAKTNDAYKGLEEQVKEHSMERCYEAVVYARVKQDEGTIDLPIGRSSRDRKKMAVLEEGGREAVTHYEVIRRFEKFTHILCKLETGRTHQIRVHLAHLGHPVAGDPVYGPKKVMTALGGQCLHAKVLGFNHPITGEKLRFEAPLPKYFSEFLLKLHGENSHPFSGCLLVSDVDGTLTSLSKVPQRNIDAIRRFMELGGRFSLSSGRAACTLHDVLRQVPVNAPVISLNGSCIYEADTGKPLLEIYLPNSVKPLTEKILEICHEVGVMLVDSDDYLVVRWGDLEIDGLRDRRAMYEKMGVCRNITMDDAPFRWMKVILIVEEGEKMEALRKLLTEIMPKGLTFVRSDRFYLEIVPSSVNKGMALENVADLLSISMSMTAAIGDQENDLEMLRTAGISCAVGGASEEIKSGVDFVAGLCENGAVADFIEYLEKNM